MSAVAEQVVLLAEDGTALGVTDKAGVHHADTPLHLALSCYVFDTDGRVLITQRALGKRTFPGVWTNSFCGHPGPGEDLHEAVHRRGLQEVGLRLHDLRLVLPGFRYRATSAEGVVENEMCPVFVARTDDVVRVEPTEVETFAWLPWREFRADVLDGSRAVSPWCVEQVAALPQDPFGVVADPGALPPAAR